MPAVMILADEDFASRERDMLARLEVGLISDGLRVLHAVPATLPELLEQGVFNQPIGYEPRGPLPPLSIRARDLAQRAMAIQPGEGVGLVHVFGRQAWPIGFEVAGLLRTALVLEVYSARLADELAGAQLDSVGERVLACVPGQGMERRCLRTLDGRHLRRIRWGVHAQDAPAADRPLAGGDRPAVLLLGTGQDKDAWGHALQALAGLRLDGDQPPLVFADAHAAHHAALRHHVERLGMDEHVSLVPQVEAFRQPVLEVDLLLLPEALHEHRSIVLDAHANGVLVAARTDPLVDELTDRYGVTQLDLADHRRWTDHLRRLFEEPGLAHQRRTAGWSAVHKDHPSTGQVAALQSLYEGLLAPPKSA